MPFLMTSNISLGYVWLPILCYLQEPSKRVKTSSRYLLENNGRINKIECMLFTWGPWLLHSHIYLNSLAVCAFRTRQR